MTVRRDDGFVSFGWVIPLWLLCLVLGGLGGSACGDESTGAPNANNQNAQSCGDGVVSGSEECDDGTANSDTVPDACRADCTRARCGDGVADTGEACDDGSQNSDLTPDACRTDCILPACGDGVVDEAAGETCDDGNTNDGDGCGAACRVEYCGNGLTQAGEVCDDGNYIAGDGCSPDCQSDESCGNGRPDFDAGETCDCGEDPTDLPIGCLAVNGDPAGGCTADCQTRYCGNGALNVGEVCDDGNTLAGDGCSPDCLSDESCGNGRPDFAAGETCDCGVDPSTLPNGCSAVNGDPDGSCTATCQTRYCGNGVLNLGEVCDDGNTLAGDGCAPDCRSDETCGNGVADFAVGETCDCGQDASDLPLGCAAVNGDPLSQCALDCQTRYCGNGLLEQGEACDDGNTEAGDGCSPDCRSDESCGNGWPDFAVGETCDCGLDASHLPTGCAAVNGDPASACGANCQLRYCGNGFLDPGEVCDDGNTLGADGCSADCLSDETCGNGSVDAEVGEQCDDGNTASGDGCQADCTLPACGDGVLDGGESCDDGNQVSGDGCSADCLSDETCGNGVIDTAAGEHCDDGNAVSGDGCSATCRLELCGNGIVDPAEVCDDGNTLGGDGCSADCHSDETCGNGIVDVVVGELCDDGNTSSGDGCQANCALPSCGDGILDPGEVCDDGNNLSGDGCSDRCSSDETCGNGVLDVAVGETCDDNNLVAGDGCGVTCRVEFCGNAIVDPGEACDDGNTTGGDGCSADCHSNESCGNGILDPAAGETCDDGNTTGGDGCSAACRLESCGNGIVDPGEACDDGNTVAGDGCSADCRSDETCGNAWPDYPAGETCDCGTSWLTLPANCAAPNGEPASPCTTDCQTRYCGNGVVNAGEVCDDGNTIAGDGCSPDCLSDESCGNGVVDVAVGESCDDGNNVSGDGCSATCAAEYCGNGVLDAGEVCDDGNFSFGDGCSADCQSDESCGNGYIDVAVGEQCDDGNLVPGDGCTENCVTEICGNGVLNGGEVCDDGNNVSGDGCSADCQSLEVCGNGYIDTAAGENCDDGNTTPGDGCNAVCVIEACGNGVVEGNEVCDDGGNQSGDGCSADCLSDESCGNGYVDGAVGEQCDDGNQASHDGCSSCCTVEILGWSELGHVQGRIPYSGFVWAYDSARDRVVVFGGSCGNNCTLNATWEFDGARWHRATPTAAPPPMTYATMAFDSLRSRSVLIGRVGVSAQTWEYDGTTWQQVSTFTAPSTTVGGMAAFAEDRGVVVLYLLGIRQTWEYNGTTWSYRQPLLTPPVLDPRSSMAFDSARGRVVLLARGSGGTPGFRPIQTWEYDGITWRKTEEDTVPSRSWHGMTYDVARGRVVVYGGEVDTVVSKSGMHPPFDEAGKVALRDTWEYDGAGWTEVSPASSPPASERPALLYDSARQRVLMVPHGAFPTTWAYDGTGWSEVVSWPEPRSGAALAHDTSRYRTVLFGGAGPSDGNGPETYAWNYESAPNAYTWEYDGLRWERKLTAYAPSPRHQHAMVYDPQRNRVVLFGGTDRVPYFEWDYDEGVDYNDTWEYDGQAWRRLSPATMPPARFGHQLAYDVARQVIVLFGGAYRSGSTVYQRDDTWEFDGTTWQQITPATKPQKRMGHVMAYDPTRGVVVVFGGLYSSGSMTLTINRLSDTWAYNGTTWQQVSVSASPTARDGSAGAYDDAQGHLLLFGGEQVALLLRDTWRLGATTWEYVTSPVVPDVRKWAAMTHDGALGATLMFGGVDWPGLHGQKPFNELWAYRRSSGCPDELCDDGIDNDGDGVVDCADPDCENKGCGAGLRCQGGGCAGFCGNGTCDAGEDAASCLVDCAGDVCGDAVCGVSEDMWSCPQDCGGSWYCGDGVCSASEDRVHCPADCSGSCGDGRCDPGEVCTADCSFCPNGVCESGEEWGGCGDQYWEGDCGTWCGDGLCELWRREDETCPQDCPAPTCGDGDCDLTETSVSCPADCGPTSGGSCGDATCDAGEDEWSCPADCPGAGFCGDGTCNAGEDALHCPSDCTTPSCCNGVCEPGEDGTSCPQDCIAICGNGHCDTGENPANCPPDCGSYCGDGYCTTPENQGMFMPGYCPTDCDITSCGDGICNVSMGWDERGSCPQDCGVIGCGDGVCDQFGAEDEVNCPADCLAGCWCGNGSCDPGEDSGSCPGDCPICGDGTCDPGENKTNCPADCIVCGDGTCDPGEDQFNCPADCSGGGFCGDMICGPGEDPFNCPVDCSGGGFCGNMICEPGEDPFNCPVDCSGGGFCGNMICEPGEDPFNCPPDCPF